MFDISVLQYYSLADIFTDTDICDERKSCNLLVKLTEHNGFKSPHDSVNVQLSAAY